MDRAMFENYYLQIYHDMYRFALYTLGNREDAEDVVSDAVMDAYYGKDSLKNHEAFKAWIFKILTVKCKRKIKDYINRPGELRSEIIENGKEEYWNVEEAQDIRNALGKLEPQERLIISMSVFGGYNSREIGKILLLKSGTVRSKLSRALDKMQNLLEG